MDMEHFVPAGHDGQDGVVVGHSTQLRSCRAKGTGRWLIYSVKRPGIDNSLVFADILAVFDNKILNVSNEASAIDPFQFIGSMVLRNGSGQE